MLDIEQEAGNAGGIHEEGRISLATPRNEDNDQPSRGQSQ